ncbi:hypothetical protein V8G54_024684 [Vigna mungo]|uniref:Uncharacterized protein n=1 Tax=Vigna mungo TaxID=3915 RepID=A0AAQ3N5Z7_VIGMU
MRGVCGGHTAMQRSDSFSPISVTLFSLGDFFQTLQTLPLLFVAVQIGAFTSIFRRRRPIRPERILHIRLALKRVSHIRRYMSHIRLSPPHQEDHNTTPSSVPATASLRRWDHRFARWSRAGANMLTKVKKNIGNAQLWMRFDRSGRFELVEWEKNAIFHHALIPARDLRILGPVFSHSSNILAGEKTMVVNLEFIKAIVTLLGKSQPKLLGAVEEQEGEIWPELSFEFQVLEIALEAVCTYLDSSVADLERGAYPVLEHWLGMLVPKILNMEQMRRWREQHPNGCVVWVIVEEATSKACLRCASDAYFFRVKPMSISISEAERRKRCFIAPNQEEEHLEKMAVVLLRDTDLDGPGPGPALLVLDITVAWFLMDEKWKLSKKEAGCSSQNSTSSTKSLFSRSCSTRGSSSNSPLLRSLSQKSSSTSKTSIPRSFSQKNPSIGKKCTSLAKEHRARFYIMRRCVAMLVCWHKHGDS